MFSKLKKNNKKLQNYANKIIPGLSGLLGKRPEMYLPGGKWPTYYSKAKGLYIWDLQGKKYLDFTMVGAGSCVLGYSDNEIDEIAKKIISMGPLTTLNPPEEIELAEILLSIHNWADQVKFARTGGEMMAVAARLARAYTKKEKIMICGYHGWHDWYLATNISNHNNLDNHLLPGLNPRGVPKALRDTIIPFNFNNFEDLINIVKERANKCAAIIMEPARNSLADKSFLNEIRKIASKNNCVLIFDEITSAWRNDTSGIHKELGVNPDLAAFGKTMANGIPIAALIGKKKIMEQVKDTFISSTNWTERLGPACAVAFIKKHKRLNLGKILQNKGKKIRDIWTQSAEDSNLKIKIDGILPLSSFKIETQNKDDWPIIITYFIQEMLKKKILASDRCYSNYCQSERFLDIYKKACRNIFKNISFYLSKGTLRKQLDGPIKQMGFQQKI
jgi:glutamate-1-semialdehyde aminotransferase|tara:strand:+ start:462 stop:1799 length:1338 start_codon:yes stop_codon:yes gene_type:complete